MGREGKYRGESVRRERGGQMVSTNVLAAFADRH